jgi:isopentenyl-diphosphate Delta-isomerase
VTEEYFDIVDANDNVIGRAPRSEVHARKLLHRAVSVFVFNSGGQFLLQKRSATKDEYPGRYTSSASGHVSSGENYDETAPRELEEELGLVAPLEYLTKFAAGPDTANEHTALYRTVCDDTPTPDPGEIESISFEDPAEVRRWIETEPDQFTPPFRKAFCWYFDEYLTRG